MSQEQFAPLVAKYAAMYGVDPGLVMKVIEAESAWNPLAVSKVRAQGLMQLMPDTAAELGVTDPFDPEQNIDGGVKYLAQMLHQFGGDESKALAAYNFGPGNVAAGKPYPPETTQYLQKILGPEKAAEVPAVFNDVVSGSSSKALIPEAPAQKKARILADPDFAKFDKATQERILARLVPEPKAPQATSPVARIAQFLGVPALQGIPDPVTPAEVGEVASDVGISALKGAVAVPEAAIGVADIASGGRAGKALAESNLDPGLAKRILDQYYSTRQKAANAAVQEAEGPLNIAIAALKNPSVIAHSAIESLPLMMGGAGVARGLLKVAPRIGATVAGGLGEGAVSAGSSAEQIRQATPGGLLTPEQSATAAASGVLTSGLGALGGKLAQRLGIADVDTMLAGAARDPWAAKGLARLIVYGAVSEGVFEELPQSVQEQVLQNKATGRPLEEGVDHAAVLGTLVGAVMGGGSNVVNAALPHEPDQARLAADLAGRVMPRVKASAAAEPNFGVPPEAALANPQNFMAQLKATLAERVAAHQAQKQAQQAAVDKLLLQKKAAERMALAERGPVRGPVPLSQPATPPEPRIVRTPQEVAAEGQSATLASQGPAPEPEVVPATEVTGRRIRPSKTPGANLVLPGDEEASRQYLAQTAEEVRAARQQAEVEALRRQKAELEKMLDEQTQPEPVADRDFVVEEAEAEATPPPLAASAESSGSETVQVPTEGPSARIAGEEYHVGEVVREGPHAGKTVESIEEGGVPVLSKRKVAAASAATSSVPVRPAAGTVPRVEAEGAAPAETPPIETIPAPPAPAPVSSSSAPPPVKLGAEGTRPDVLTALKVKQPPKAAPKPRPDVLQALGITKKPLAVPPKVAEMEARAGRTAADDWQDSVDGLDELDAKDIEYRDILPEDLRSRLDKGETWRSRVVRQIARQKGQEPVATSTQKVLETRPAGQTTATSPAAPAGAPRVRTPDVMREDWEERQVVPPEFLSSWRREHQGGPPTVEQIQKDLPKWLAKMGAGRKKTPPPAAPKKVPPSTGGDSGIAMAEVSPGKAIGVTQPRLIKELAQNLYAGDLGTVVVKEGLQNAVDSIPKGKKGRISVSVDNRTKTFVIQDDGIGMLPNVVKNQFLDPGSSYKPEGGRGGYGIAKIALLTHADDVSVTTVARKSDGTLTETSLRGSGERWLDPDNPMDVTTREMPEGTPTGTKVSIRLGKEALVSDWSMQDWLGKFMRDQKLAHKFDVQVDGHAITGGSSSEGRGGVPSMRRFGEQDWFAWGGANTFLDNTDPLIGETQLTINGKPTDVTVLADAEGVNIVPVEADNEGFIFDWPDGEKASSSQHARQLLARAWQDENFWAQNPDLMAQPTKRHNLLDTKKLPGSDVEFWTGTQFHDTQWLSIEVLNDGLPQFTHTVTLPNATKMPTEIQVNIKPKVDTTSGEYPFTPNRQQMRDRVQQVVDSFIRTELYTQGIKQEQDLYRNAMKNRTPISGSSLQLYETTGAIPKEILAEVAADPSVGAVASMVSSLLKSAARTLAASPMGGLPQFAPERFGMGLGFSGGKWYGVNLDAGRIFGDLAKDPRRPTLKEGQKLFHILLDPWLTIDSVPAGLTLEEQAEHFAREFWGTAIHEIMHNVYRSHDQDFSSAITKWLPQTVAEGMKLSRRMKGVVKNDPGFIDRLRAQSRQLSTEHRAHGGGKDVLGPVSVEQAAGRGPGGGGPQDRSGAGVPAGRGEEAGGTGGAATVSPKGSEQPKDHVDGDQFSPDTPLRVPPVGEFSHGSMWPVGQNGIRTKTPEVGYHVTTAEHLESIASKGLLGSERGWGNSAVALSDELYPLGHPDAIEELNKPVDQGRGQLVTPESHHRSVVLKVRVPEGKVYDDYEVREFTGTRTDQGPDANIGTETSFLVPRTVPPENIYVVEPGTRAETPLTEYVAKLKAEGKFPKQDVEWAKAMTPKYSVVEADPPGQGRRRTAQEVAEDRRLLQRRQQLRTEAERVYQEEYLPLLAAEDEARQTFSDEPVAKKREEAYARYKRLSDEANAVPVKYSVQPNELGFYSQLERVLDDPKTQAAQRGQDWVRFLRDPRRGVKVDELRWTGLDDFLAAWKDQRVSKDEILRHLRDNQVEVREVELTTGLTEKEKARLDELDSKLRAYGSGDPSQTHQKLTEAEQAELTDLESFGHTKGRMSTRLKDRGLAHYASRPELRMPGGENYREFLLTLPEKARRVTGADLKAQGWRVRVDRKNEFTGQQEYTILDPEGNFQGARTGAPINETEAQILDGMAKELSKPPAGRFTAGHYTKYPNTLAHVRTTDRVDADGKKVLLIEELQSDWARKGRKEGFQKPVDLGPLKAQLAEAEQRYDEAQEALEAKEKELGVWNEDGVTDRFDQLTPEQQDELNDLYNTTGYARNQVDRFEEELAEAPSRTKGVPAAPFVDSAEGWVTLVLRRMVRRAAEEGYDRIAWTTGKQQAERYDLSKQVDQIEWSHDPDDGNFKVMTTLKGGGPGPASSIDPKDLPDYVGKELAEKITDAQKRGHTSGFFEGIDLKLGGEWARNLYDRMVPQMLGKLGKKFGAQVGEAQFTPKEAAKPVRWKSGTDQGEDFAYANLGNGRELRVYEGDEGVRGAVVEGDEVEEIPQFSYVLRENGKVVASSSDPMRAQTIAEAKEEALRLVGGVEEPFTAHSLPITPAMRESALGEGFPQFSTDRTVKFWKGIGGHTYVAELDGKWVYVGNGPDDAKRFHDAVKAAGMRAERVLEEPKLVTRAFNKHGRTMAALKKEMPVWDGMVQAPPDYTMVDENRTNVSLPSINEVRANLPPTLAEGLIERHGSFHISTPRGHITIRPTLDIELNWHAIEAGHGPQAVSDIRSGRRRVVGHTQSIGRDAVVQIVEAGALPHEVGGHVFLDHFATAEEHRVISRSLKKAADAEGRTVDEVFGDGFRDWFLHDKEIRENETTFQKIYRLIYEFFAGIVNAYRPTLEGTYREVARGHAFERKPLDSTADPGYDGEVGKYDVKQFRSKAQQQAQKLSKLTDEELERLDALEQDREDTGELSDELVELRKRAQANEQYYSQELTGAADDMIPSVRKRFEKEDPDKFTVDFLPPPRKKGQKKEGKKLDFMKALKIRKPESEK